MRRGNGIFDYKIFLNYNCFAVIEELKIVSINWRKKMSKGILLFAFILAIFFIALAWQLLKIAISEQKNTKKWPVIPLAAVIVIALLAILAIYAAANMN